MLTYHPLKIAELRPEGSEAVCVTLDVPDELRGHPFPPNLLISLVENAIKHGVEPSADGGSVKLAAERHDDAMVVTAKAGRSAWFTVKSAELSYEESAGVFVPNRRWHHHVESGPVPTSEAAGCSQP